jgi:hypothetical protein
MGGESSQHLTPAVPYFLIQKRVIGILLADQF